MRDPVTHEMVLKGRARGGLYELPLSMNQSRAALSCVRQSHSLWHCRLRHLNSKSMSALMNNGLITSDSSQPKICDACLVGKSHALPHSTHKTVYAPLNVVYVDIWGPVLRQLRGCRN